jgi:integrase
MSVRKREWITRKGEHKTAWIVDYFDQDGDRHIRTFERKKDADAFHATVGVEVRSGVHTAPAKSITVAAAGENWIAFVEGKKRERTTVDSYQLHLRLYIKPRLGHLKLAALTRPMVEMFCDELVKDLSRPMARKVLGSLKMLLKDAQRRGQVAQNVAAGAKIELSKRGKRKIKAGTDFPLPQEVTSIVNAAPDGKARALLMVLAFAGPRASEARGLRWTDVTLRKDGGTLAIEQRADRFGKIGAPKSESGQRSIPVGPLVANTLRRLKLKATGELVFGTGTDKPENHSNVVQRIFHRAQLAAGVVDAKGNPKYSGLHSLRHFAASWMLHRREDGGLGLSLKEAQERLGHATLAMTADTYGHLLPRHDDGAELAAAERHLFAV